MLCIASDTFVLDAALGAAASETDAVSGVTTAPALTVRGEGGRHADGDVKANLAGQRWDVAAVKIDDNEIRGRMTVSGSPIIGSANLEGRFSGRGVVGKLFDDEGKVLADFEGTVTRSVAEVVLLNALRHRRRRSG